MLNLISIISLIVAITVHEFAHAFTADRLGDPTPRSQGRLSLNPLVHLDLIGSLMLLIAGFGWGKPVPVDSYNFSRPRRDEMLVGLAGPASNLLLALITALIIRATGYFANPLIVFIAMNLTLGIFNLLPIFPLDGSKIFLNLLPFEKSIEIGDFLERYGNFILLALLILPLGGPSFISRILSPATTFLLQLLLG